MVKVVSYCLFGNNKKYLIGALRNAQLVAKFYPGFEAWFYVHKESVPQYIIDSLKLFDHVRIIIKDLNLTDSRPLMWRYEAIDDPEVEIMLSRDVDSRIYKREKLAVIEWLESGKLFHIMRDHPYHSYVILAGMFGTRKLPGLPTWKPLIDQIPMIGSDYDQFFLSNIIYPRICNNAIIHASYHQYEGPSQCRPFPILYSADDFHFVGEYIDEYEIRNHIHYKVISTTIFESNRSIILDDETKKETKLYLSTNLSDDKIKLKKMSDELEIESKISEVTVSDEDLETGTFMIAEEHYGSEGKEIIEKIVSCAYPKMKVIWQNSPKSRLLARGHGSHDYFESHHIPYLTYSGESYLVPIRDYPPIAKLNTVHINDPLSYYIPFILSRLWHRDYKYPNIRNFDSDEFRKRPYFWDIAQGMRSR